MKTLPEVLHFWKSLVSSVRNCNTSTPHRLAADSAAGPLARSRAHSPDRGGGRAWRVPGSRPASSRYGQHGDASRGRWPAGVPSAGPRSPDRAATRRGAAPPARSPAAPSPRSAPRRAAGPEAPRSLTHSRTRSEAHARREAEPSAPHPSLPPRERPSGPGVSRTGGGAGADRLARPRPAEGSATSATRRRRHAPARPLAALRRAELRLLAPRPAGVALLERAVRTADPRGESRGLGRRWAAV